jgi:hypothetical protein
MLINANGTTSLSMEAGKEYVLSAAGTFGGGTLTPKWSDGTTDTTVVGPSGDLALTAGSAYVVVAPTSSLKLVLTGASSPSINASVIARIR